MFYVYEWYVLETNEVFYVGKGSKNRYKQTRKRNKIFQKYYNNFNCDSRIIKTFINEQDAFNFEHEYIIELKSKGFAKANLDYGGKGGCNFIWTNEMRKYKSIYNPMKEKSQIQRMKNNNPMKDEKIKNKVREKKYRKVIINGIEYKGVKIASQILNVSEFTVSTWCKRGYDTFGNPCRYSDEIQKEYPLIKKIHPKASTNKSVIIDGIKFLTVKDGAEYIGVWSESLIRAIKRNKKCKGHICKYDNQQPSHMNSYNSNMEGSTTNV